MSITEIAWEVHRHPRSIHGPQGIAYYRADVTGSEYLKVKAQDGAWRWDVYDHSTYRLGHPHRLDGGSRPTLTAAKAAALDAWNKREAS